MGSLLHRFKHFKNVVILSRLAESKDLGTKRTENGNGVRRSLDALRLLGMTRFLLFSLVHIVLDATTW